MAVPSARVLLGTVAAIAALTVAGCLPPRSVATGQAGWKRTLDETQQAITAGRYEDADSILTAFGRAHEGSAEALESSYWRAIVRLDPANRGGGPAAATPDLDLYLAGSPTLPHWREASVLRRLAGQLTSAAHLAASQTSAQQAAVGRAVAATDDHAKDEELQRLRAELAKANEELDRIKKRLATPRP